MCSRSTHDFKKRAEDLGKGKKWKKGKQLLWEFMIQWDDVSLNKADPSYHPPHLTLLGPSLPFASMQDIYKCCYSRCPFQGTLCQSRLQYASWSPTRRDERKQKKAKKGIEGVLLAWHTLQNKPFLWLAVLLAGLTNISSRCMSTQYDEMRWVVLCVPSDRV